MTANNAVEATEYRRITAERWGREERKLISIIMAAIAVTGFLTIGLAFNASHCAE
jgi:hypothetical protein